MKTPTRFDPETARFIAREVFAKGRFERDDQEPSDFVSQAARAVDRMCYEAEHAVSLAAPDEPLPCPFCGEAPSVFWSNWMNRPSVCCGSQECARAGAQVQTYGPTRAEAITRWNRRATARPS